MRKDQYLPQYLSECPPKISKPISAIVFGFCGCPWINSLQKGTRHKTRPEDHCRDDAIHLLRIFCTKSEKYVKTISEKYIMMISEKYIKTMSEKYIKTISEKYIKTISEKYIFYHTGCFLHWASPKKLKYRKPT